MPKHATTEVTSVSDKAWNHLNKDFRHAVVYLREENEAAGNVDQLRQLISERKLIRLVTSWERVSQLWRQRQGPFSHVKLKEAESAKNI